MFKFSRSFAPQTNQQQKKQQTESTLTDIALFNRMLECSTHSQQNEIQNTHTHIHRRGETGHRKTQSQLRTHNIRVIYWNIK